jgi:phosphoribosylformylglycinamidine (FGAM) synthase-like amidotransferase family enzyme
MKYYRLALDDQPRLTWLIHVQDSRSGRLSPLSEYEGFVCPRCGKFSYDDVFDHGFVKAARLKRPSGDIIATDDGFYCANPRFT